ncbi:LLM class flavin-dependent oxidoreductase [Paenibacillus sp. BSR1-1]|uniref:LLM class flavin-dependent oxidoreductase n=1 Tax=Paenibacillus sp. BSR1-1 TaxID=3020845 RepID=UPI0025AEE696|nr:LLM class flavin-dependent oxidoreductase [Paenibacillus sp. BSR1-1]MDN3016201.1 LLM class flavin-dependent oxidoreductase [Paenibacillus sp. BSR1-1]
MGCGHGGRYKKIYLFCTSHVPTMHPIVAAKMIATIDDISKGRIGLNTVVGWFPKEMGMFGGSRLEHDQGYRYSTEWLEVVLKLWSEQYFDHKGEFFEINDGFSEPKPVQNPRPVLISAGTSPAGRDYAARFCDFNFGYIESIEQGAKWTETVKKLAWEEYKREINTFTTSFVVCRPTEKEAKDYYNYYVREQGDWEAATIITEMFGMHASSHSSDYLSKAKEKFLGGWGGWPLVGTPEQVAEGLIELSKTGVSGSLVTFVDYLQEMPYFNENVLPLLEQAGLRNPVEKDSKKAENKNSEVSTESKTFINA